MYLTGLFQSLNAFRSLRGSLIVQLVESLPAMQETPVQFLGQEDPLEKGKAFWPGEFHGLYSPWGSQRVRHD